MWFISGGKAIYPSVLMNAVAAKLAGVKRIFQLALQKIKTGIEILASAKLSGVDKVLMIGSQAIAVLTHGTKTIESDKIFNQEMHLQQGEKASF